MQDAGAGKAHRFRDAQGLRIYEVQGGVGPSDSFSGDCHVLTGFVFSPIDALALRIHGEYDMRIGYLRTLILFGWFRIFSCKTTLAVDD